MSRQKRTSTALDKAKLRATSLSSVDETLDLNNGVTLVGYKAKIAETEAKLAAYNKMLSDLDALLNDLQKSEEELNTLSARMLAAVGVVYGKDSNEYEQAGGTRTSERARRSYTAPS